MHAYMHVCMHACMQVRHVELPGGVVGLTAGSGSRGFADGAGGSASFNNPMGVTLSPDNRLAYIADMNNHAIRVITLPTTAAWTGRRLAALGVGSVATLCGSGGAGNADGIAEVARFNRPRALASKWMHACMPRTLPPCCL